MSASTTEQAFADLKERLSRLSDLGRIGRVLGWDQQVMMPPGGAAARAEQLGTLGRIAHEALIDDEVGRLLEQLSGYEESLPHDSFEASLIRVARRDYEKASRVPPELSADMARAASLGHQAWLEARAESDYARFVPALERNLELKHRYVECFEPAGEAYDVLLDDFEPEMTTAEVRQVFSRLKEELVPLIAAVRDSADAVDGALAQGPFPIERQRGAVLAILTPLGFDDVVVAARPHGPPVRVGLGPHGHPHHHALRRGRAHGRVRRASTSSATASTSTARRPSSTARRSAAASPSGSTSRRAGSGRTSSAAAGRSGAGSSRVCGTRSRRCSGRPTRRASTGR